MTKKKPLIISHWYHLIEGMQESSQNFYSLIEQALQRRQIPNISTSRIDYREGGIFSARREYFRVERKEHIFDICAAPFGTGFFVSWWLGEISLGWLWDLITDIPVAGRILLWIFKPLTYYQLDTSLMFQESVRSAVMEVVDQITQSKGLRLLSEAERKPIMSSFVKR